MKVDVLKFACSGCGGLGNRKLKQRDDDADAEVNA